MRRSVVFKTSEDKVLAVVEDVSEDETLSSVRQRAQKMYPCDNYYYVLFGIPLKAKQEGKTIARDCWNRIADGRFVIEVKEENTVTERSKPKADPETPSSVVAAAVASPSTSSGASEHEFKVAKMQRFSDAEIEENTELFSKERMRFHNGMVDKIRIDESLSDWGPQELLGVVESSWVMTKTELLKLKVKEILSEDISSTTDCQGRDKVLMRAFNTLEKAHFDVNHGYSQFSEEVGKNESKRASLESKFDEVFSALKKAQANLQKSIEAFRKNNPLHKSGVNDQCESQMSVELEDSEIASLADDIKKDYEND